MKKSDWWLRASEEAKMMQIVGGHELGLTQQQIASNLKTDTISIRDFCTKHSIKLSMDVDTIPVDNWKVEETAVIEKFKEIDNTRVAFAFTLFENNDSNWSMNLWDEIEN